jgi:hypothetical protein
MTRTLNMSVSNTGFLLDRFSHDCGPLQYIRELTQNSIEAIRKAGREKGLIVWDFDAVTYDRTGIKKLCITDNGCGMSADEQVRYINSLSCSGSVQAIDKNYGIGAKISSAARNHAGIEYLSWKDGAGSMICLWKDQVTGEYGLRPLGDEDSIEHVASLNDSVINKFPVIAEYGSGTHVVLHGSTDNEDTFSKSAELSERGAGQWVRKYLNTRYFRIPSNIRIDCRSAGGGDEGFRYVTGQGAVLDAVAGDSKGKVQLKNATAYWWIVPPVNAAIPPIMMPGARKPVASMKTFNPSYYTTGHMAALFQDELHDTIRGTQGRSMLQQCGVLVGYEQVIIYVEPTGSGVAPNMARTQLLIDGESLPWGDWADEFRAKLPKPIKDFMSTIQPASHDTKNEDERIRSVMDLYKVPKYKPAANGPVLAGHTDSGIVPGRREPNPDPRPRPDRPPSPSKGSAYSELLNPSGVRATEVISSQSLPALSWVSVEDGTRSPDMFPNHAAWFTLPNQVNANADFGGLKLLVDKFAAGYDNDPAARVVITEVVKTWWSQTLRECIQGLRGLVASGIWSRAELNQILSSEKSADLLTAAVMPKYLVHQAMNREIAGKLGKARAVEAA